MKLNYFFRGVLSSFIILAFVQCESKAKETKPATTKTQAVTSGNTSSAKLNIAYINVDSLLMGYNYAIDLNEALLRKQENARATINEKGKSLEKEVTDFQRKIKSNAFLSEERAQQEATRIQKLEQNLNELSNRLNNELMVEQQKMNVLLNDSVTNFLTQFNKVKNYDMIFTNTLNDNIIIAKPQYDITHEVLEELNLRYKPKSK